MNEKNSNTISKAVISRLPMYFRLLRELLDEGTDRISSEEISRKMNATASQVRQDLNHFGGFGQQGYGYNVKHLYTEIGKILGVEKSHNLIVIGAGNIGRALVNFNGFEDQGFNFCGIFDINESICGNSVNGIRIRHYSELDNFIQNRDIDIVTLAIPHQNAKKVARELYDLGLRCFWNFTQTDLLLPVDAIVKNVHLLDSLLELSFSMSRR